LIWDLCKAGRLGYDAVYSLPVHYRTFYYKKLIKDMEREKAAYDTASGKQELGKKSMSRGPG
jgi:hypothetical protein